MKKEHFDKYLEKSGDSEIITTNLIENEFGFASWQPTQNEIVIINVFGNGQYWDGFFQALAKKLGKKRIKFATKRSPKAFMKKYNYKLTGYILEKEVSDG